MGMKGVKAVWCILIVGVLLLAVSSTAERDTEKEVEEEVRWCKKDCDWKAGADTEKAKECKQHCDERRRRHGQEDGDRCESKCQSHEEWWKKARCMQECKQHQKRREGGGGNSDYEAIEAKCNEECEDVQRPLSKKMCFQACMEYELFGGHEFINSDGKRRHGGGHCQTLCKRFRPGSYDRQQCVDKCRSQKPEEDEEEVMNLNHHGHGGGGHGGHGGSSRSCEEDCQKRYRHGYEKQQCVRDCKSGGGGGAGGRGREGDERRHDWETVAETVLKEV